MSELSHHGVKGQKWGVRRYQNKDGSLTKAGRLHYKQDDLILRKGHPLTNVSTASKLQLNKKNLNVSTTDHDYKVYSGPFASAKLNEERAKGNHDVKIYDHTLEIKKNAVIAGEKAQKEKFDEYFSKNKKLVEKALHDDYLKFREMGAIKGSTPYEKFSKDNERMFKLFQYGSLRQYLSADSKNMPKDSAKYALTNAYIKSMHKQKYAGVVDLLDKGKWYGAESPHTIFNPKKLAKPYHTEELHEWGIAINEYELIGNGYKSSDIKDLI